MKEYEQYLVPSHGPVAQPKEYEQFLMGGQNPAGDASSSIMNMPDALKGVSMDPSTSDYLMQRVISELGKMALTSWGGNLGAMIPKFPGLGSILGQSAGQFTGEMGRQQLMGEQPDIKRAGGEAAGVGGLGLGVLGIARTSSAIGGISGKDYAEAVKRPVLTKGAPREAELNLGEQLTAEIGGRGLTAGKEHLNSMLAAADSAGKKIDAVPILDSIEAQIGQGVEKGNAAADSMFKGIRARMLNRVISEAPDGMVKPSALNKIIEEEFTAPLHQYYERVGGTQYLERLASVRQEAAKYLYSQLGEGAASAAGLAHAELSTRETLQNLLPTGTPAKPNTSLGSRVAEATNPTNVGAGPVMERATKNYDQMYGTDWWNKMNDLRINRQFSPLDKSQSAQIAQLPVIGYEPRSLIQRAGLNVARPLIRGVRGTGGAVRSVAVSEASRKLSKKSDNKANP